MRSVCSRSPGLPPKPVKYIDPIVQDAIIDAQTIVISSMTHFDDDTGLKETLNQASRTYLTTLKNNLAVRLPAWQKRTLLVELRNSQQHSETKQPILKFLVSAMARAINLAKPVDQTLYKNDIIKNYDLTKDICYHNIIANHKTQFSEARTLAPNDSLLGVCEQTLIQKYPHYYLGYSLFLQQQTQRLEAPRADARPKLPFQVVPQLTMKLRFITFGKEQVTELVTAMSKDPTIFDGQAVSNHVSNLFTDVQMAFCYGQM
jgi:hypothetical protein